MDDKDKLHKVATMLLSNLRGTDFDLLIYKSVFDALRQSIPVPNMAQLLRDARESKELRRMIVDKYAPIERGLQQLGRKDQETAVLELLKSWKPSGPAN